MYKILEKTPLNPTVTKMVIEAPLVAKKAEPGQFIIFRASEDGERVPLTIADYDRKAGTVTIIFQIVGGATMELNALNAGDSLVDFVGPLGTPSKLEGLKKVAVVGGGNVAMDAARCAKRLGAENVYIVYRRSMNELPARKEEVEHAVEEGIIFKTLSNPVEVLGDADGSVCGMRCVEMELGEPDASGRRRPVVKEGSEFVLEVDCMVMSIGTSPNPLIRSTTPGLETNSHGCIITNGDDGLTTRNAVYAGGDAVTGAATVILAMGAGKHAAKAIDEYIKSKDNA